MNKRRFFRSVGAAGLGGVLVLSTTAVTTAAPPEQGGGLSLPVVGNFPGGGTFAGTFLLEQFDVVAGQLVAVGTLSGTLTDALGNVVGTVTNVPLTLPVDEANGTCEILHLELGPLDLDLLGLVVHLDRVVLDITAESGSGNLLGNLLCAVAHLLDSNAAPRALANLLNQILGALG